MIIPAINNVWTCGDHPVVFVELKIDNRYVIAVCAYGMVWKVESL